MIGSGWARAQIADLRLWFRSQGAAEGKGRGRASDADLSSDGGSEGGFVLSSTVWGVEDRFDLFCLDCGSALRTGAFGPSVESVRCPTCKGKLEISGETPAISEPRVHSRFSPFRR